MIIESVFEYQKPIPLKYTCSGENVSPPLKFLNVPSSSKTLVLIMDDPDAPVGVFDHWVVWNIPPTFQGLSEGAKELFSNAKVKQGTNGYNVVGYKGPCPPPGKVHRYFFKLYALNTELTLPEGSSKKDVEKGMKGHIIEEAELVGTYQR
ncbi:MAG: YbhB/YbcL family Raf kinase inhibitor-like protein [Parachlamydiaceae bacterium]|nr:YbhB/YbcL family Raf kinase inhibitor-like protein [Parachlamydiaceae bacterium]